LKNIGEIENSRELELKKISNIIFTNTQIIANTSKFKNNLSDKKIQKVK